MSRRPRVYSDQAIRRLSIRLTVEQWNHVDRMARFYCQTPTERLETIIGDHLVRLGLERNERPRTYVDFAGREQEEADVR